MTSTNSPDRLALVMIEYQREWLGEDGKLGPMLPDKVAVEATVEASRRLLEAARRSGTAVVHVGYRFAPGHPEVGERPQGIHRMSKEFGTFSGLGADFLESRGKRRRGRGRIAGRRRCRPLLAELAAERGGELGDPACHLLRRVLGQVVPGVGDHAARQLRRIGPELVVRGRDAPLPTQRQHGHAKR